MKELGKNWMMKINKEIQSPAEKIQQRRLQMLIHSYIYYELDLQIIDDATWSKWAMELVKLNQKFPALAKKGKYAAQFKDWNGSSGAHLKYDKKTKDKAEELLKMKGVI